MEVGQFHDVNSTMMEGPALPPDIVERVRRAAEESAHADKVAQMTKIYMAAYTQQGIGITEEQARERVLALADLDLALVQATAPSPSEPVAPPPEPARPSAATKRAKPPRARKLTAAKKKAAPKKQPVVRKMTKKAAAAAAAEQPPARLSKKAAAAEQPPARLSKRAIKATLNEPLQTDMELTEEFQERLKEVALKTGFRREVLIKIDSKTGELRNPVRVAGAYKAWDTRDKKNRRRRRKRIAITPGEQIKRSQRGKKASAKRIRRLMRSKRLSRSVAALQIMNPAKAGREARATA